MLQNTKRLINWIQDKLEGEFISQGNYTKSYLGFDNNISQEDLDILCSIGTTLLIHMGESKMIINTMGEIFMYDLREKITK